MKIVEIIPYSEEFAPFVKSLNVAWLEKYFVVEPFDEMVLSNPKEEIIDKGGKIFFAKYQNNIVGTFTLLKIDNHTFELSKMAVAENIQGIGIGKKMMDYCIEYAENNKIKKLVLYSNIILETAIRMYRKYGFIEVSLGSTVYKRANIKMEKVIFE